MEELLTFFNTYGLALTLIAIGGIAILGILKYSNVFKGLEERKRHYLYLAISISLSIIGSTIYLKCINQLTFDLIFAVAGALYVLNQAFYNIFKVLSINDFIKFLLNKIKGLISNRGKEE